MVVIKTMIMVNTMNTFTNGVEGRGGRREFFVIYAINFV